MANDSDFITTTACSVTNFSDQIPICAGELNNHIVKVLGNTGCNGVSLVNDDQLTGDHQVCVLADGSRIETPITKVNINTLILMGK